jgi:hypothetical protein
LWRAGKPRFLGNAWILDTDGVKIELWQPK